MKILKPDRVPGRKIVRYAFERLPKGISAMLHKAIKRVRKRLSLRKKQRRKEAFGLLLKAFNSTIDQEVFELIEGLTQIQAAYAKSRPEGDRWVDLLQHKLRLLIDPRFTQPMSLPFAFSVLQREIKLRQQLVKDAVHVKVDPVLPLFSEAYIEPVILNAAVLFVVEYCAWHSKRRGAVRVSIREGTSPVIVIQTNLKRKDNSFTLPQGSVVEEAKAHLQKTLNLFSGRERVFERQHDAEGKLVFQLFSHNGLEERPLWDEVEHALSEPAERVSESVAGDGRVYMSHTEVYKIQLLHHRHDKPLRLVEEYNLLRSLRGVEGIPQVSRLEETPRWVRFSYKRIHGMPLDEYLEQHHYEKAKWFRCLAELTFRLHQIHTRGVIHRDVKPENVLVEASGKVHLIDFDQAVAGSEQARQLDLSGEPTPQIPDCKSIRYLIGKLGLNEAYRAAVQALQAAWEMAAKSSASAPGKHIAYYNWSFCEEELKGERDWFIRWGLIYPAIRDMLPGASVLELGCNMGLLGTYLKLYGAGRVVGVDIDQDILEAGKKLSRTAGVDVTYLKGDLSSSGFVKEHLINQSFDLVSALSVLQWLPGREAIYPVLEKAPLLLFEGHDPTSQELRWLKNLGFKQVNILGYSERLRALYLASR